MWVVCSQGIYEGLGKLLSFVWELYRDGVDAWLPHLLVAMNLLGE